MENSQPPATGRDALGRFLPGRSGNPAGKQPGTRNRATTLRAVLNDGEDIAAAPAPAFALHRLDRAGGAPKPAPPPSAPPASAPYATARRGGLAATLLGSTALTAQAAPG